MMREVASYFSGYIVSQKEVMCINKTYIYIIQLINLKQKNKVFQRDIYIHQKYIYIIYLIGKKPLKSLSLFLFLSL